MRLQLTYMTGQHALRFLEMYVRRAMSRRIAALQRDLDDAPAAVAGAGASASADV